MAGARIRALIVDDEGLARRGIRARLAGEADIEIVGEATGGTAAVLAIAELSPDLVFLDVQMPGLDGFGVITEVGADRMPLTIFVTAWDQHALRAFDAHALDYLLKPIDGERFRQSLQRARRRLADQRSSALGRRLAAVIAEAVEPTDAAPTVAGGAEAGAAAERTAAPAAYLDRFLIRSGGRVLLITADEVDWIEASGDYVRLHAGRTSHLLRERLSSIADRVDPGRFARIHRSTIVNVERIRELQPYFNREFIVVLKDGTKLKLSRTYRAALETLFGDSL